MVRFICLALLVGCVAACGAAPELRRGAVEQEIPPGYGFGSAKINGQEVDLFTWINSIPDERLLRLPENDRALMAAALTEAQIESLPLSKQQALRSAKFDEAAEVSEGVEVRQDGQLIDLYQAVSETPAEELAGLPVDLRKAMSQQLTPEELDSLPASKREALDH